MQQGKLTYGKENKINVFNGRIMEMEGLPDLKAGTNELTEATADRSCSGSTIKLSEDTVAEYLRSHVMKHEKMDLIYLCE
jgi:aconitate hydratase 2 / 2-methylisocitrate dehydratase